MAKEKSIKHEHLTEHHAGHVHGGDMTGMAVSATLHCITGCSIGEIMGMIIGTILNLSNAANIALAVVLSFVFGYSLSILPVLKGGVKFGHAFKLILASDTLSIATMEIVDNTIIAAIPGALNANLVNPLYWITLPLSLVAAFFVAVPVNKYLLSRGKGHALVHEYM